MERGGYLNLEKTVSTLESAFFPTTYKSLYLRTLFQTCPFVVLGERIQFHFQNTEYGLVYYIGGHF